VVGGDETEAAFHPAFEHCSLRAVGIEAPTFEQFQVTGTEASLLAPGWLASFTARRQQAEDDLHVMTEDAGSRGQVGGLFQQVEQAFVNFAHTGNIQRLRVLVECEG
jgi:hypothetical protein